MKDFIAANKKYIVLLAAGLILLIMPWFSGGAPAAKSSDEEKFRQVMENAEGVGKMEIMTNKTEKGAVSGVVIVAQGAQDLQVKKEIADAAAAAFNVVPHKIQVFSYKQEVESNENR